MSELPPTPGPPPPGPPPLGPPPAHPPYAAYPTAPPPAGPPPWGPPPVGPPPRSNRALVVVLGLLAALVVIAAAVVIPLVLSGDEEEKEPRAGEPTLEQVEEFADLDATHTEEDQDYPQSPAVGGPHSASWLDCGVYDEPVREENVVHDLEHGTVWITYEPGLDEESVAALEELLPQNGILSPYDDLRAPVVVTVWGRQLELTGADDPRLALFIEELGAGETAPEPNASCLGGIDNPTTGTVA